tara:strand:- start:19 stop:345 length:327 start_codon:yes stop_codon:yes gene_type:complete
MTYREQINYDNMSNALREAGVSFEDNTYVDDVTASISVLLPGTTKLGALIGRPHWLEEEFQIYIPNSDTFDPENGCLNTFSVTLIEQGRTVDFRRPEEVVEYLQQFTN